LCLCLAFLLLALCLCLVAFFFLAAAGSGTSRSPMATDEFTLPPKGTQRASEPTASTDFSIVTRSLAIVTSRTGPASSPPSISRPVAPTEKVPEMGFTPECMPATVITSSPSPATATAAVATDSGRAGTGASSDAGPRV